MFKVMVKHLNFVNCGFTEKQLGLHSDFQCFTEENYSMYVVSSHTVLLHLKISILHLTTLLSINIFH